MGTLVRTLIGIALVVIVTAGAACGRESESLEARCERWAWGIVESVDEPSDEVERMIWSNGLDPDPPALCYEAAQRSALTDEGTISGTRIEEVIRCLTGGDECGPRNLASLLRSDERLLRLAPAVRLVILEGLVVLSDYDGVARLHSLGPNFRALEGFQALADVAGVTPEQAQTAASVIERAGIARFGTEKVLLPESPCVLGCDERVAIIDPAVVERAQRRDR